jgi:outer membrane protein OmpA-like peptidoglycan-associated protein
LGQASEVLNTDPKCKPVVFLQLTWSKGDHMVARPTCKTLNDLKGTEKKVKIALQTGGPHVGMLDDVLKTAGLKWNDVDVVWTKGVTGKDGPAELFRKDASVDACFVISPDMQGLTGGLDKTGSGAEGTVKGAHVLVSTVSLKRSIADVYACRKDYYDKHKGIVEKVAAGYLKGCEELLDLKAKAARKDKQAEASYGVILKMAQQIYGKDVLGNDAEADGLISDAQFVGLPGNQAFFRGKGNLSGFEPRMESALKMALEGGWASRKAGFLAPDFDFEKGGKLDKLAGGIKGKVGPGIDKGAELDRVLFTFKITFEPNQSVFSEEKYGKDFKRAVELASLFGNAVITVRGHADPSLLLDEFEKAGLAKGILKRDGKAFTLKDGTKISLEDAKNMTRIAEVIRKEKFDGVTPNPQAILAGLDKLSQDRANKVFAAVQKYATGQSFALDKNQIKPVGVGILEPVVPRSKTAQQHASNRRVEFSIYSIKPKERVAEGVEYDY